MISIGSISLTKILEYLYLDGTNLRWKKINSNRVKLNAIAGCSDHHGYWKVAIEGTEYKLHRLLYQVYHSIEILSTEIQVDHINGNRSDNSKSNLRLITHAGNCYNSRGKSKIQKYKGISKVSKNNKYKARIMVNRKEIHLGCFDDIMDAAKAYDEAAKMYFGEEAQLNFS